MRSVHHINSYEISSSDQLLWDQFMRSTLVRSVHQINSREISSSDQLLWDKSTRSTLRVLALTADGSRSRIDKQSTLAAVLLHTLQQLQRCIFGPVVWYSMTNIPKFTVLQTLDLIELEGKYMHLGLGDKLISELISWELTSWSDLMKSWSHELISFTWVWHNQEMKIFRTNFYSWITVHHTWDW